MQFLLLAAALAACAQAACTATSNLTVTLDYGVYQGSAQAGGLNFWSGIRYAAPPTGTSRWQMPTTPTTDKSSVTPNVGPGNYGCPQAGPAPYGGDSCPTNLSNISSVPAGCAPFYSEDCLHLNVTSPANANSLPVLVLIHGGGYGAGQAIFNVAGLLAANNNGFVTVAIQYRLNAFGFLASSDFYSQGGLLNAGLQDQLFALQWVNKYICQFGGDPTKVTIAGQSAGGGSVMQQTLAMNGAFGNKYFRYAIAHSPYLPKQYNYQDGVPNSFYNTFASSVGCSGATALACLQQKDSNLLQVAARRASASGLHGTWAFVPVVDPTFLLQRPSAQFYSNTPLNGDAILTNNNANEGADFIQQNVATYADFQNYVELAFPNVSYSQLVAQYQANNQSDKAKGLLFATNGNGQPSALNQSSVATGQQQRVNDLYAETTFVCPSYWLADGFSSRSGKTAYKTQFSIPVALHNDDLPGYFSGANGPAYLSPQYISAARQMWGNFIIKGNPQIPNTVANGNPTSTAPNDAATWTPWTPSARYMLNLNQTGGTTTVTNVATFTNIPVVVGPGLKNSFNLVFARPWEAGRGVRCDFWKSNGALVPE